MKLSISSKMKPTVSIEIEDETEYLLKDEANREHLERVIAADKSGNYYRTMSMEELENMVS